MTDTAERLLNAARTKLSGTLSRLSKKEFKVNAQDKEAVRKLLEETSIAHHRSRCLHVFWNGHPDGHRKLLFPLCRRWKDHLRPREGHRSDDSMDSKEKARSEGQDETAEDGDAEKGKKRRNQGSSVDRDGRGNEPDSSHNGMR
jgi:hypothetical protein